MNPRPVHNPRTPVSGRLSLRLAVILSIVLLAGAVITVRAISRGKQAAPTLLESQTCPVKRGPLVMSLLASGTVKARQSTEVKCMVRGNVKITWIIDEGTIVKPGDKLAELEAADLQELVIKQRIQVAQAQAEYEQARQNVENQKSQNYSDIIIAQNKLDMAVLDLEKYVKGDYQQKIREAEAAIKLAEAELERANDRVDGTKKLLAKGYVNRGELEADTLAQTKCQIELDKAKSAKELLEKYEYKRETSSLETAKEGADEELKRTKKSAESELANKQTLLSSNKSQLDLENFQLTNLEEQLKNTVIYAPQGGMVVYAQNDYADESNRIRQGGQIYYRQKIIDLPDFSNWTVEARIHESMIQQVKAGQTATVAIDAFQGRTVPATVSRISVLPDSSNRWYAPETKEYLVYLDLTTTTLPLKPGMSTKAEILLDSLKDALYIPVQAIANLDGKPTVYVMTEVGPRAQVVQVGLSNDRFAEIRSGLREGDQVVLSTSGAAPATDKDDDADKDSKDAKDGKAATDAKPGQAEAGAGKAAPTPQGTVAPATRDEARS